MYLIAFTSGKGGVGKSCVAAYTGVALSEANKKTVLVETGMAARSLDIIVGSGKAVFDLGDVLSGACKAADAVAGTYSPNLFLLPAPAGPYVRPGEGEMQALFKELRREYDYVLVDGPDFGATSPALFDNILLVTTPDLLSVRACQSLARDLYDEEAAGIRLVINDVPTQVAPIPGAKDFDDVIDMIGAQLIGVLPHSPKLHYGANNSLPLDEESITVQIYESLAARLRGQSRPLLIR